MYRSFSSFCFISYYFHALKKKQTEDVQKNDDFKIFLAFRSYHLISKGGKKEEVKTGRMEKKIHRRRNTHENTQSRFEEFTMLHTHEI